MRFCIHQVLASCSAENTAPLLSAVESKGVDVEACAVDYDFATDVLEWRSLGVDRRRGRPDLENAHAASAAIAGWPHPGPLNNKQHGYP